VPRASGSHLAVSHAWPASPDPGSLVRAPGRRSGTAGGWSTDGERL